MNVAACGEPPRASRTRLFPVRDYDLAATLNSGQAFRWQLQAGPSAEKVLKHDDNLLLQVQQKVAAVGQSGSWADPVSNAGRAAGPATSAERLPPARQPVGEELPPRRAEGQRSGSWAAVVGQRAVVLRQTEAGLEAQVAEPIADWRWLSEYLQTDVDLPAVLATFPDDEPLRAAVAACRGLRLLRQGAWECLASFILSSTKQITQIRQIVAELCRRFGEPLASPVPAEAVFSFPSAERLARCTEAELRACKAGFRAPYLLATARRVAAGECDLARLHRLPLKEARAELVKLPGVGPKIADCALLFAFGFPTAFPLDVWVLRALRQLYFPRRRVTLKRLRNFAAGHFGPHAGYAQQYLFHYLRTQHGKPSPP
jgi:N-glycosylase/DNA lyase